jgi:hypothetical protein
MKYKINHRGHRVNLILCVTDTSCSPKEFPLKEITERIISYAIEVHSTLDPGLLESVYEEALAYEFELRGINFERQKEIMLEYKGRRIFYNSLILNILCALCG